MTVPRPSKKPRVIQYSMRKERAKLKRDLLTGKSQILLPVESERVNVIDDKKQKQKQKLLGKDDAMKKTKSEKNIKEKKDVRSGLDNIEEFVASNFIEHTISSHLKEMDKKRRIRVYEKDPKHSNYD